MNYIEQIKGFWITQEINQLSTSEIAMYFYFLEIWNKAGWTDSFKRNNYKVMGDLSIRSFKTFHGIRNKLRQAGILGFDQTNGVANVKYTMADLSKIYRGKGKGQEDNDDLSKKYQGIGQGSGKGSGQGPGKGSGQGSGVVNININKTETKPNIRKRPRASKSETFEKKLSPAPRETFSDPPDPNEVIKFFLGAGGTEAMALKFFNKWAASDWMDGRRRITNFRPLANNFIANYYEKEKKDADQRSNQKSHEAGRSITFDNP